MLTIGAYIRIPAAVLIGFACTAATCDTKPPANDLCTATSTITVHCAPDEKGKPDCLSKSGYDSLSPATLREVYEFNGLRDRVCPSR